MDDTREAQLREEWKGFLTHQVERGYCHHCGYEHRSPTPPNLDLLFNEINNLRYCLLQAQRELGARWLVMRNQQELNKAVAALNRWERLYERGSGEGLDPDLGKHLERDVENAQINLTESRQALEIILLEKPHG